MKNTEFMASGWGIHFFDTPCITLPFAFSVFDITFSLGYYFPILPNSYILFTFIEITTNIAVPFNFFFRMMKNSLLSMMNTKNVLYVIEFPLPFTPLNFKNWNYRTMKISFLSKEVSEIEMEWN